MTRDVLLERASTLVGRKESARWDLGDTPPSLLVLELCLLQESLVERVALRAERGDWVVRLGRASAPDHTSFRWYAERRLEVLLGGVELSRWLAFFLRYYRDGCAEVDHIDVEGAATGGGRFDLVLRVGRSDAPVSAEEARRRLGF